MMFLPSPLDLQEVITVKVGEHLFKIAPAPTLTSASEVYRTPPTTKASQKCAATPSITGHCTFDCILQPCALTTENTPQLIYQCPSRWFQHILLTH